MASVIFMTALCLPAPVSGAPLNELFLYSSQGSIRGINLTTQSEAIITTSPFTNSVNALDINEPAGLVYYGSGTSVYYWDVALGTGANAHFLLNDFSSGPVQAPITNINSTAGSFFNGKYYVGSEANNGFILDVFELTVSADGKSVLSAQPLNVLTACGCTSVELGGFGDVLTREEAGVLVMYGASTDLTNSGAGTSAGRWKMDLTTNTWTLLQAGAGSQIAMDNSSNLYVNVGNSIRTFDPVTGVVGGLSLFTTSGAMYELSRGFIFDYGDAPLSYGTPIHRQTAGVASTAFFGPNDPENETFLQSGQFGGQDGSGDDIDGFDDEDAVASLSPLTVFGNSYSVNVQCVNGAAVTAWADFNANGVFDLNERNDNHPLSCNSGSANFQWSNITPVAGVTYVRFRTANDAIDVINPTGYAASGEVEDHSLLVTAPVQGNCPAGSSSTVIAATDLPKPIGPNAGTITTSIIDVPANVTITDVNLQTVVGTHTYMADLIFDLKRNGSTVRLYGPTCNFQNDFSFGFDDAAGGTPPCPPTDGNDYSPTGNLSVFNGQSSAGNWTLEILDRYNGDAGQLNSWSLEICSAENPDVRIGKQVSVADDVVSITLLAKNVGDVPLSSIQITDNLDSVFGAGNYSIASAPVLVAAPAGFSINSAYTGIPGGEKLLDTSGALQVNEEIRIEFSVLVSNTSASATGDFTNQASIVASSPLGSNIADLSGNGLDLSSDNDDPTPFSITLGMIISGFVFEDSSVDVNTSHNGIFESNEVGVANQLVSIVDTATSTTLATVATSSNGSWSYALESSYVGQTIEIVVTPNSAYQFISEASAVATNPITDGKISITPVSISNLTDINIGVIKQPQLQLSQSGSAEPAQSIQYAHTYIAPTHGLLDVSLNATVNPATPDWPIRLVRDLDCDGAIQNLDSILVGPTTVTPSQPLCVIVDLFVPANAVQGAISSVELLTSLDVADVSGSGHAVMQDIANLDVTTVGDSGAGKIRLSKTVTNITQLGLAVLANTASPGDVLEYAVTFSNTGASEVTDLVINDQVPAYSSFDAGSVQCNSLPPSVQCTPAVSGSFVSWELLGAIPAGGTGTVIYRVIVD